MKLNNKGITLMELIVSIALISIVVMFLFRLLTDIRYTNKNTDFNREDQQTRAIVLKHIEEEFLTRKLIGLKSTSPSIDTLIITFYYMDGTTATLKFKNDVNSYIEYENTGLGTKEKWFLEKENEDTSFNLHCVKYSSSLSSPGSEEYYYVRFSIPVVVNKERPNPLDDFEFSYVGLKSYLNPSTSFPNTPGLGDYHEDRC